MPSTRSHTNRNQISKIWLLGEQEPIISTDCKLPSNGQVLNCYFYYKKTEYKNPRECMRFVVKMCEDLLMFKLLILLKVGVFIYQEDYCPTLFFIINNALTEIFDYVQKKSSLRQIFAEFFF